MIDRVNLSVIILSGLFSIATAQWLETTIYIPDSLCGVIEPCAFTYNSTNNKIYVGGGGSRVIVIDGATNQKIAAIPVGVKISDLCYNPTNNKVYCANYFSNDVTVIDGATDSVITTIRVGSQPCALCYNSTNNKVYCASYYGNNVTVIDGVTNNVITTISVGAQPCALCYNSTNNKVYCANAASDNVTVIDGATNGVITTISVGDGPWALCYNPANNKVYCANAASDNVTVIDGVTNSVITTISVGDVPSTLTCNPPQNRIYVANYLGSSISILRDIVGIEEGLWGNSECLHLKIFPNPLHFFTSITYSLSRPANVWFRIYDVAGRCVRTLVSEKQEPGWHNVNWDGRDDRMVRLAPGIYFLRIEVDGYRLTSKMVVL
ncbi:MAG: FlgD immunoglobulin-like domain containing protein [candidate division WOR-3 bacterium]